MAEILKSTSASANLMKAIWYDTDVTTAINKLIASGKTSVNVTPTDLGCSDPAVGTRKLLVLLFSTPAPNKALTTTTIVSQYDFGVIQLSASPPVKPVSG